MIWLIGIFCLKVILIKFSIDIIIELFDFQRLLFNSYIKMGLDNENPTLFNKSEEREVNEKDLDDNESEEFDSREIFGNF